tara:strand:+ start:133 stop:474 length:342 start_codon:yes stop_codon:yes gene_type:complete
MWQLYGSAIGWSCKAAKVVGFAESLETRSYDIIFPTIIINRQRKEISYSYLHLKQRYETNFHIKEENKFNIIATVIVDATWGDILHFHKKNHTFSKAFLGDTGNTLSFGECFN